MIAETLGIYPLNRSLLKEDFVRYFVNYAKNLGCFNYGTCNLTIDWKKDFQIFQAEISADSDIELIPFKEVFRRFQHLLIPYRSSLNNEIQYYQGIVTKGKPNAM